MNGDLTNIIKDRLGKLPNDLKTAISSIDIEGSLAEITKRNRLLIDQAGILQTEVVMTILGIEPVANFMRNVAKELNVPTEKAAQIAQDADTLIFKNIRAALQKLNQQEEKEEKVIDRSSGPEALSREQVLDEIENPVKTRPTSNSTFGQTQDTSVPKPPNNLPVKAPENDMTINTASLPQKTDGITITNSVSDKKEIENILEANLRGAVSLPKGQKTIEEKTKIPSKGSGDPYREPIE